MSLGYISLAAFRVFNIFIQNGYIHPDEFFQTTEIITGDIFGVVHERPWEFNIDAPVRSVALLYGIFGIPLCVAKYIFKLYKIPWDPFLLLFVFRLATCALSFVTDYSVYKICKILKLKPNQYLILLSSSYVLIVFGTKTLTNSIELALVSLLLWQVVESMSMSEKVLAAENKIQSIYAHSTLITDKVIMSRKLHRLPSHHFYHCLEIGTILAIGTFNRPTFLLFAATPIFYWISRGFSNSYNHFVRVFNTRFMVLFICALPGVFLLILVDSIYFEYITDNKVKWVITPLNFIKYNLKPSNLAEHGIHFRGTHALINTPILFNVLTFLFLGCLQLNSFAKIIINRHYHLLPNINKVNTLMVANVIIPLLLLSIFPHQEPRFLLPLLLPIVFTTSKYFSYPSVKGTQHLFNIWCFFNIIGLIFFGYLHQAGVTPMISHLFKNIKHDTNTHIIHSHIYSIPTGLLMVPQQNEKIPYMYQRHIEVHDLGSSLDSSVLFDTVENICKQIATEKEPVVYFALSGPLSKHFELNGNTSTISYTKQTFFPHISMESLSAYLTSMIDLLNHGKNETYFTNFMKFREIFSLVLYKINYNQD